MMQIRQTEQMEIHELSDEELEQVSSATKTLYQILLETKVILLMRRNFCTGPL
jgi:hypothetical protein